MYTRFFSLFLVVFSQLAASTQEKLFFLHMPKTGGLSTRYCLEEKYSSRDCKAISSVHLEKNKDVFNRKKFVSGHFYFYDVAPLINDFKTFTVLRDPIQRVLSEYRYAIKRNKFIDASHFLLEEGSPLETISNVNCMVLSRLDPRDHSISIEQHLASAKRTLEEFYFVGLTDCLEESLILLHQKLGWEAPHQISCHNTTEKFYETYPEELLTAIAKRNWADIELYEFAKNLYAKQKEEILDVGVQEPSIDWSDRVAYTFDQPFDASGWCQREKESTSLVGWLKNPRYKSFSFRWLGHPENASIYFSLQPQDYFLTCSLKFSDPLKYPLQVLVNEHPVPYELLEDAEGWNLLKAKIDRTWLVPGQKTKITFSIEDQERVPQKDFYRGRCAVREVRFTSSDERDHSEPLGPLTRLLGMRYKKISPVRETGGNCWATNR